MKVACGRTPQCESLANFRLLRASGLCHAGLRLRGYVLTIRLWFHFVVAIAVPWPKPASLTLLKEQSCSTYYFATINLVTLRRQPSLKKNAALLFLARAATIGV